jgi:hypothetical protein
MSVLLFPEQPHFTEILDILGYTPDDIELYRHSLEHFIWGHVLRAHLERLSPEEKKYLQDRIVQKPDDPAIIPRELAQMQGTAELRKTIEEVSSQALSLALTQLEHQIPADRPDHRKKFKLLAAELKPIEIHIGEWLKHEPLFKSLFTEETISYSAVDRIREQAAASLEMVRQKCRALGLPDTVEPLQVTREIDETMYCLEQVLVAS